ncbi:hypothetical protein [Sphingomonas sp. LHG3406-1]|uniref:hypothetical protein n=1 Tax=Sphingomonas sp. LHG3406-1 TaxID=2804617 RepID=UPI002609CBCB|nr:hypothetical protein [Sphingomonas sp. LHG3406-1]
MSLLALLAAAALYPASTGIAGPPAPPVRVLPGWHPTTAPDLRALRREVEEGRQRGELSRREARELKREAREIGRLEERYAAGGLTAAEEAELRARVEVVKAIARGKRLGTIR